MKTRLLSFLGAIIALSAFSQGQAHLGFYNDSAHLFVIGTAVPGDPTGPIPASPLPSGNSLVAQLYAGTAADSMALYATSLLDTNGWGGSPGYGGPTNGLMNVVHVVATGIPAGTVDYFNIVVSDVVGAVGSPFVQGPASNAVYYGTSGTFTATPPSSLAYPPLFPLNGNINMSTWAPADLVINAVPNSPTVTLAVFPQAGGGLQIVTSAALTVRTYDFVLESTTNRIDWTAMDTSALSYDIRTGNLMGTNIVETANSMTFYRVEAIGR